METTNHSFLEIVNEQKNYFPVLILLMSFMWKCKPTFSLGLKRKEARLDCFNPPPEDAMTWTELVWTSPTGMPLATEFWDGATRSPSLASSSSLSSNKIDVAISLFLFETPETEKICWMWGKLYPPWTDRKITFDLKFPLNEMKLVNIGSMPNDKSRYIHKYSELLHTYNLPT